MANESEKQTTATTLAEFRLKEFECLRKEIELILQNLRRTEDYCLLVVGGVWAWLITSQLTHSPAVLLPCILAVLFYAKRSLMEKSLEPFSEYIKSYETSLGGKFWETFISGRRDYMRWWFHGFYIVIILLSVIAAYLLWSGGVVLPSAPVVR